MLGECGAGFEGIRDKDLWAGIFRMALQWMRGSLSAECGVDDLFGGWGGWIVWR